MIKYVHNLLDDLPEEIGHSVTLSAVDYLFQVRDEKYPDTKCLPKEQARYYQY